MQTHLLIVPVIKKLGAYSTPIALIDSNRDDTRDIAHCAVRALTEDDHAGADYLKKYMNGCLPPQIAVS